jgi:hypothetical protein
MVSFDVNNSIQSSMSVTRQPNSAVGKGATKKIGSPNSAVRKGASGQKEVCLKSDPERAPAGLNIARDWSNSDLRSNFLLESFNPIQRGRARSYFV